MNPRTPGRLIGASLGPGDPALITRRAWAALGSGARWAYPVKKAEESSYALGIVRRGGLEVPADAEALVFPMTRDPAALARAWARLVAVQATDPETARTGRQLVMLMVVALGIVVALAAVFARFPALGYAARALGGVEHLKENQRLAQV